MGGDEVIAAPGTPGRLLINVANGLGHQVLVYKSPGRSAGAYATFTPTNLPLVEQVQTFSLDIAAEAQPSWYRVEVRGPGAPSGIDLSQIEDADTDPVAAVEYLATLVLPNQLCAVTAPVYVSAAPVEAQPEIPLPADQGQADGAVAALAAVGGFAGFPAIAHAAGVSHVVAEVHGDGTTAVVYTRIARNGAAAPVDLTSAVSRQARFPKVAAQGKEVWVVWQDERAGERPHRPAIYLRHSSNGGLNWQPEQRVRALDGRAEHPAIALTPSGQPVLAWQEISAGNPFDVMVQQLGVDAQPVNLSRPGKSFHAANLYDTRSALYPASVWPAVAVAPSGELAVAWQDDRTDKDPLWTGGLGYTDGTDPDNWQIMVATRQPGAAGWNAPASLGADTQADRHPALTFTSSGRLVAAWDSKILASSGANLSVLSAWSDDGGRSWTPPAAVALDQNAMSQRPALDRDAAGDAMLVWYDSRSADWRWRLMSATLGQGQGQGQAWSPATLLPSPGNNTWPAVSNGAVVFAGTRNAQRLQRDHTQQIFYRAP